MKDWVIRALKTFWQAALASLFVELPMIAPQIGEGWAAIKPIALSIGVGAVAAGLSAIYNKFISPLFSKEEEENE